MTDLRKAAEMALELLENHVEDPRCEVFICKVISELRQALADQKQKPVGWMYVNKDGECEQMEYGPIPFWDDDITLLYAEPPKREWQGLTDEELGQFTTWGYVSHVEVPLLADLFRTIEAKLKEKNT